MAGKNPEAADNTQATAGINNQRIILMGASTGGFNVIKAIVKDLPPNLSASIFIVWHMSPDIRSILPRMLNQVNTIYAAHAIDGEEILPNRIYLAPPDHHLLVEEGYVRVTHGPKENRFRPAVDPLFRSAAYAYGKRVIGVVLSGALDDGTAGLWAIKHYGGTTVVQDPKDAEMPSMPENALQQVEVDYCLPVAELGGLLGRLSAAEQTQNGKVVKDERTKAEIKIAAEDSSEAIQLFKSGKLTEFTCPECHGVLSKLTEGRLVRYRCHTGHAFSPDTLLAAITENIETSMYNAIRGIDESVALLNHLGDHFAEANNTRLAAMYFKKAKEADERSNLVRKAVFDHEQLSKETLAQEVSGGNGKSDS